MDPADVPFALRLPPPLVAGPFTRPMAARVGVGRRALDRMLRAGVVRRVLRGVYVDATLPDTTALRAGALALVLPPRSVAVDRTAGWLHGLHVEAGIPTPAEVGLDVLGRGGADRHRHYGAPRRLASRDAVDVGGVGASTPVRTALDLARLLARDRGLAVLDAALRLGWGGQGDLVAGLSGLGRLRGCPRARELVGLADGCARTAAESVLRLRWLEAGLPAPVLHPEGGTVLALALPAERFGVALGAPVDVPGWSVLVLPPARVLGADAHLLEEHLHREYLRHLLRRAG
jgi:hypothetical protein